MCKFFGYTEIIFIYIHTTYRVRQRNIVLFSITIGGGQWQGRNRACHEKDETHRPSAFEYIDIQNARSECAN